MKIEQNSATFGAMLFVVTFVFLIQNKFVIEENISGLTHSFFEDESVNKRKYALCQSPCAVSGHS